MFNGLSWIATTLAMLLPLLYIAKKKGKFRFAYIALTIVAPPVGILAVLLSRPEKDAEDQTDPSLKAKLALGLLPLWGTLGLTVLGYVSAPSTEFWNATPWYIVFSLPLCCLTLIALDLGTRFRSRSLKA